MASKRPEVQLLFLGLLTIADREGRLEDRPVKIKGQIFPFQDMDVNAALDELVTITDPFQDRPFIYRYEVEGRRYIQIVNFNKHQHIHPNEVASIIPPMQSVEPEEIRSTPDSLEPCHEPSAPKVTPARALPSLPSCTSLQGARASEPVGKDVKNFLTVFPAVTVPKFIRDDPEWMDWLRKWFAHLLEKSRLQPDKAITEVTVQNHIDELAGRQRDRCIEVISYSISSHGWKLYWDHKPPPPKSAIVESKQDKQPRKKQIFEPEMEKKWKGKSDEPA